MTNYCSSYTTNFQTYAGSYRFGFNGQEKDNEIAGIGNINTAKFWSYDTRLGRRWNIDPVDQINISNYAVMGDNPIVYADPLGDEKGEKVKNDDGTYSTLSCDDVLIKGKKYPTTGNKTADERISLDLRLSNTLTGVANDYEGRFEDKVNWVNRGEAENFAEMLQMSRYQQKHIQLTGKAIEMLRNDEEFLKFREIAIDKLASGHTSYTSPLPVTFGGKKNGSVLGLVMILPNTIDVWKATLNQATWMVRNVHVTATSMPDGSIKYHLKDRFDLEPSATRGDATYNTGAEISGYIYHDLLNNTGSDVEAEWYEF